MDRENMGDLSLPMYDDFIEGGALFTEPDIMSHKTKPSVKERSTFLKRSFRSIIESCFSPCALASMYWSENPMKLTEDKYKEYQSLSPYQKNTIYENHPHLLNVTDLTFLLLDVDYNEAIRYQ